MAGDLHTHSTCSDGSVPIHRLPLMAARLGLSALALSDHDTTLSAQYAYDHPVQDGVRLIPAAELTGYDFERSHRVHLLTFWPDLDCPALRRHCDIMRQRRNECALQSCREIEALYPQFRTEQALEYAQDSGVLFKSGIMQALQQLGLCDGIYTGLYHELFGWEPRGKCLHSPTYPPVREVLATAKAAGAVVVFAHPTVYKSMPLLRELVETLCPNGKPLRFTGVTREMAVFLQQRFSDAVWQPDPAAYDYIYRTEDLITLKGKRYHKKRNHLHQFQERYNWTFAPLTAADQDACIAFSAALYNEKKGYDDRSSIVEQFAIHTFFTHWDTLGLCGGVLRVDGKLVGFSIGEPLNRDTFVTHIEKADVAYQGSYTALTQAFTAQFAKDYRYINREEDLGIAGLRQAKASYYPVYLLEKGDLVIPASMR